MFALARTMVLLGASDAGVAAIDGIYADFKNEYGLRGECLEALRDGFIGKMAIHPVQIAVINAAFTPSKETLMRAHQIIEAFTSAGDTGVISVDGRMLDRPHLRLAQRILAQAKHSI